MVGSDRWRPISEVIAQIAVYEVHKQYQPKRYEVKCIEEGCGKAWVDRGNNFPISCGSRHTKATGHACVAVITTTVYLTREEEETDG